MYNLYQEFIIREGECPAPLWPCVVTVRPTVDLVTSLSYNCGFSGFRAYTSALHVCNHIYIKSFITCILMSQGLTVTTHVQCHIMYVLVKLWLEWFISFLKVCKFHKPQKAMYAMPCLYYGCGQDQSLPMATMTPEC